jgi:recombination protein RecT
MSENLPVKNGRDIKAFLESQIDRLKAVCDKLVSPEKLIQLAAICAYRNPQIAECSPPSVLAAVIQAASLGLDLHPSSGEAYLIPRWNSSAKCLECHFQAGYQGLCRLVRQAGTRYIHARVVREADTFTWRYSPELEMNHEPSREADAGAVIGAYAVARTETNELIGEFMTLAELEKIRAKSQSPNKGPWQDYPEEMQKKTVCRRLCKWLPKSPKLVEALASIDDDFRPDDGPEGTPDALPGQTKTEKLAGLVAARVNATKSNGAAAPAPEAVQVAEVSPPFDIPAKSEPLPPRNGVELESAADRDNSRAWFAAFGQAKGFPRKLVFWSEGMVKQAWDEYRKPKAVA